MNFKIDGVNFKRTGKYIQGQYNSIRAWELNWPEEVRKWRGHIYDTDLGKFVARPFEKFFKFEDPFGINEEEFNKLIADESVTVGLKTKLDGTLMFLWNSDSVPTLSTKKMINFEENSGSIVNYHELGYNFLHEYAFNKLYKDDWIKKHTILFELIHTSNRIVTKYDYKDEGLYIIAIRNTETGIEIDKNDDIYKNIRIKTGIPIIQDEEFEKKYLLQNMLDYQKRNEDKNISEGYVVSFKGKDGITKRVKFITNQYKNLKWIVTHSSNKHYYLWLKNNKFKENFELLPEDLKLEASAFLKKQQNKIEEIKSHLPDNIKPGTEEYHNFLVRTFNKNMIGYAHAISKNKKIAIKLDHLDLNVTN